MVTKQIKYQKLYTFWADNYVSSCIWMKYMDCKMKYTNCDSLGILDSKNGFPTRDAYEVYKHTFDSFS